MKREEVKLSDCFFELLKKYENLLIKTGDKNFDEYVKNFCSKDLENRKGELKKNIRVLDDKIHLLEYYKQKINEYEMSVSEQNWLYQTLEEREQNFKILRFLSKYSNIYARSNCIRKMKKEKKDNQCELQAIESVDKFPERREIIEKYKVADVYYLKLEGEFREYLNANPRNKFIQNYGQSIKRFDRKFFDSHIKEINDLQDGMQITFDF